VGGLFGWEVEVRAGGGDVWVVGGRWWEVGAYVWVGKN